MLKTLESPLDCKEIQPVHPKGNQSWVFIGRSDTEAETPIFWPPDAKSWLIWKKPWCWERLKAGGEGDNRGWDGTMASPTQWAWVWISSRSWWWTGRSGLLWFMGSQRVRYDWATELNVCVYYFICVCVCVYSYLETVCLSIFNSSFWCTIMNYNTFINSYFLLFSHVQ